MRVLYLFCGLPRKADIREFLQKFASSDEFEFEIREVDIERSSDDDLAESSLWSDLLDQVKRGRWDVVVLSPPCGTWSRARYQWKVHPGPKPLRSSIWPLGFPWLSDQCRKQVEIANYFVFQSILAAGLAAESGGFYLIEHPEDLGEVAGEVPASIWQLPEMRQLVEKTQGTTWAVYQCKYSALSPKPTRFASNIRQCKNFQFSSWPKFDSKHRYLGPLPKSCGHRFHVKKLIGKDVSGKWRTSPSASYPSGLCKYLAAIIASVRSYRGVDSVELEPLEQSVSSLQQSVQQSVVSTNSQSDQCGGSSNQVEKDGKCSSSSPSKVRFPPSPPLGKPTGDVKGVRFPSYGNWGSPLIVEWDGEVREFVDGLGICSSNRWRPECRGIGLDTEAIDLLSKLFDLVSTFVQEQLGDLRLAAFKLVLGKFEGSPFSEASLETIRCEWSKLLASPQAAMVRAEGQPFFLDLMAQTLRALGDPDWEILTSVGYHNGFHTDAEVWHLTWLNYSHFNHRPKRVLLRFSS